MTTATAPRARLCVADWEQAALDALAECDLAAVSVEALARSLGVTKGSFYWHFESREALLQAALAHWEGNDADDLINRVAAVSDPRERLRQLFRDASHPDRAHSIHGALLRAVDNPVVKPVIARVSGRGLEFMAQAFRECGLSESDAAHRARLAYAAYIGFRQLSSQFGVPRLSASALRDYVEHVIGTLVPA
ncbi:MAG: TetR/AcrR family transcriptional regulator [Lysobacterales bacterium]